VFVEELVDQLDDTDANHMDICKPYRGVLRFIETNAPTSGTPRQDGSESEADYNINTVFGIHRGETLHYVQRTRVDDALIGHLIGGKHLCIYGSSKQGKTALRKKHIASSEELCVVCDRLWNVVDVFTAILKAAHCEVQPASEESASSLYRVRVPSDEKPTDIDLSHTADF
jgi:hypothetical protein